jgi:hypothetical protein
MELALLPITSSESLIVSGEQILPALVLEVELGLAYQLLERMQIFMVEISRSELGAGSQFVLTLPLTQDQPIVEVPIAELPTY